MLNRELLTETIAGRGDVLRHQDLSKAKIIPEFLLIQIPAVKAMSYIAKPHPITCFHKYVLAILASRQLLLYSKLFHLRQLNLLSIPRTFPTYACPMAYLVEFGTS